RVPGSTGQNQSPGHVFRGKRMPGHLGDKRRTISNLIVVRVDTERQLLLVKGSVPGSKGRDVVVRPAVKISKPVVQQAKPQAKAQAKPAARPEPKPEAKPQANRARAGMTSSPLWRGGGKIFPNSPDENFSHKVNRRMYRAGLCAILSQLAREDRLRVVDEFVLDAPKTKLLAKKVKDMGFDELLV